MPGAHEHQAMHATPASGSYVPNAPMPGTVVVSTIDYLTVMYERLLTLARARADEMLIPGGGSVHYDKLLAIQTKAQAIAYQITTVMRTARRPESQVVEDEERVLAHEINNELAVWGIRMN